MAKNENKVNPIRITNEAGEVFTLEFSRESVRFAEQQGFKILELTDYPQTNIPALFYYAFRKNHRNISRGQADAMFDELGGLTAEMINRLVQLYNLPNESLILLDESERKNSKLTVEL
jgi:hypothetical protein